MEEFFDNELVKRFETMIENNEEAYFDTEEYEDIIIYYLELGDISFAELAVNHALNLHPNSLEIKIKQLEVLLELEDHTKARVLMNELHQSSMDNVDFLVCCAKYYSNLGNPRRAIEYCEKALNLGEEENFLHNFLGDEYYNLDDPFNALKHYKLALQHDPEDDFALENAVACFQALNRGKEALEFLTHYLEQYPFSEMAWFELGQFHFNRKNYADAIKAFDYVLAINSESVGVYANKASCYEAMEEWQKAIEVYEELLDLEFTKAFTHYRIGLCHKELNQPVLALKSFQNSLREDPQFYMAMMEQSDIYQEMGNPKEALYFAKEAVSYNENNVEYQKKLAFLLIDSGKFEESLTCLKKLVEIEPNRFYNWYAYSEVLMIIQEFEDAITILNQAIQLHNRAELFYQLSNCYYNLQDEQKGREVLSKALEIDPSIVQDMVAKYPYIKEGVKKVKAKKK